MGIKKLALKGSALGSVLLFARIAVSFFLMPFIIRMLGEYFYGLWILISAFIGYYGMLDLGIGGSVLRFVSREIGAGRHENTKYYVSSAFFLLCGLGLLIILVSIVSAWGASFFITDQENLSFFRFAVLILGLSIGLSFPLRVFDGVLGAHIRFDLKRYIEFGELVIRTAGIIILLKLGYGIYGLALITAVVGIAELLAKTWACFKVDSHLRIALKFFSIPRIKEMGEFALVTFLNGLTNILTNRLDPYVVALVSNVTTVAYYGVALTLTNYFGEFFRVTQAVLFPMFSQKEGAGDLGGLGQWLLMGSRIGTIMAIFVGGLALLYGKQFLVLWLGPHFYISYLYLAILISPMILAFGLFPSVFVLNSTGRHRLATILDVWRGSVNLALSLILGYSMGAAGVAWGTAVPCVIFDVVLKPYYACRSISLRPALLLSCTLRAILQTCLLMAPVWWFFGRDVHADYFSLIRIFLIHAGVFLSAGTFVFLNRQQRATINTFFKPYIERMVGCRKSA